MPDEISVSISEKTLCRRYGYSTFVDIVGDGSKRWISVSDNLLQFPPFEKIPCASLEKVKEVHESCLFWFELLVNLPHVFQPNLVWQFLRLVGNTRPDTLEKFFF